MTGVEPPTNAWGQPLSTTAATDQSEATFAAPSPETIQALIARTRVLRSQPLASLIRSLFRVVARRL